MVKEAEITLGTVVLDVFGEYTPAEPMVHTEQNGDPGHPGSPSEFDISKIEHHGYDVTSLIDELENLISEDTVDIWNALTDRAIEEIEK